MTDETGSITGAGSDVASLNRSQPLIKALREATPTLMKSVSSQQPTRAFFQKKQTGFEKILADLDTMQKSLA
jgi:hypothetical protein